MTEETKCPHCGKPVTHIGLDGICPECMLQAGATTQRPGDQMGPNGTKIAKTPPCPTPDDIAKHFPHLDILECLGRGGMGVVYKARQPKLNREVALKLLAPEKGDDPRFAERFEREAQALARLNHPNIVAIHDFGQTEVKTDVEDIAGSAGTKSGAATSVSPPGQPPPASRTSPPSVTGTRFTLGYSVVGAFALAECGLIALGVVTNAVHWLVVAAAAGGVWGVATMFCTAHALDKRGIRINYPLLGLMMILEYLPRYRALTLQETGRVGPLFYSYIVAMNLALVAVVLAWIVTRW